MYKHPEEYAKGKASQFPGEGGPVILTIENVPDDVLAAANRDGWFPPSNGVVQFDAGAGLEELLAIWVTLPKTIRAI